MRARVGVCVCVVDMNSVVMGAYIGVYYMGVYIHTYIHICVIQVVKEFLRGG